MKRNWWRRFAQAHVVCQRGGYFHQPLRPVLVYISVVGQQWYDAPQQCGLRVKARQRLLFILAKIACVSARSSSIVRVFLFSGLGSSSVGITGGLTIPCRGRAPNYRRVLSDVSGFLSARTCRYSDLNQSASGQIKSGPSGSGVGIITTLLMAVATLVVVVKAVRNPGVLSRCSLRSITSCV